MDEDVVVGVVLVAGAARAAERGGANVLNGALDVPLPPAGASASTYQIMSKNVNVTVPVRLAGTPAAGASVTV